MGSNSDGDGEIMVGIAAHICAAAPGGPRYNPQQTNDQRRSADNGIWLCSNHSIAVDAKDSNFTIEVLRQWKVQAQKDSLRRVLYSDVRDHSTVRANDDELRRRLRIAAATDLEVFRRTDKWPVSSIPSMLEVEGLDHPISAPTLATVLTSLDDLILVAPPGMGKTTTLFQVAEAVLANGNAAPIVVPLGDWSTDGTALLESILKRPAYRGITEDDVRTVAAKSGVILLLDGWNELDSLARKRLAVQVARLQAELPELSLLISTRKQALNVPVEGTRVNLLPLSETQQLDIAKALRGDAGLRIMDEAWRTSGVRGLVTIPLYLTALLTLPEGVPFPTTKEEVLHRFVTVHEEDGQRAEELSEVMHGLHQRFLEDLAVTATHVGNTTIADADARRSVSATNGALEVDGQITNKLQPNAVLESLVSRHVLMRAGDPVGYSFQHQQFQEWYASHFVERLMLASNENPTSRDQLKADVLNRLPWEESVLFACERLARGEQEQRRACAAAITAAFEVDPILAADMICRSTDPVWALVGPTILSLVKRWHTPGKVDRAFRFMIRSGQTEFLHLVWPLLTHQDDQVHLSALRAGKHFHPSILGPDVVSRIEALPSTIRKHVLYEMASNSGIEGLDLAAAIAKNETDSEVKAMVVDALAFRRADRHVIDILRSADDKAFDLVLRHNIINESTDEHVKKGLEAARARQAQGSSSDYERLRTIMHSQGEEDLGDEVATLISTMEIDKEQDAKVALLHEMRGRYSRAIAEGLLQRARDNRPLFYGAADLLALAGLELEDDILVDIALSESGNHYDHRAEAVATVLGPKAVGRMIETALEAQQRWRSEDGKFYKKEADRYRELVDRVRQTPSKSLVTAVRERFAKSSIEELAELAELIYRHKDAGDDSGRPFDAQTRTQIAQLAEEFGNRALTSAEAKRSQLASVALLVSRARSARLLPLLERLLDEELRRYRVFRQEAHAMGWRQGLITNEARTLHTDAYRRAFLSMPVRETASLVQKYLSDQYFGEAAARILAGNWITANEPDERRYWGSVDFSRVPEKRFKRVTHVTTTSEEAEAIFSVIEPLIADEAMEDQKRHAVALGIVGARLPHGQRSATINKLISLASRHSRVALLQNLVLSGEYIDVETVKRGITELLDEAKTNAWVLSQGNELKEWLRLLPFATPSADAFGAVQALPNQQRAPRYLEEMIRGYGTAPGEDAENVLFQLGEADPRFYADHTWHEAVIRRNSLSAAQRYVDLAAKELFEQKGLDRRHVARQLGRLIDEHPQLRQRIYERLDSEAMTPGLELLASAVAEQPDPDGLLLLINLEIKHQRDFMSWDTIENVVTKDVLSESWQGAYEVVPVPAPELRRQLLAWTTDGGLLDRAAHCLNRIDKIRDVYGSPDSEPRHPDIASRKPWPILPSGLDR